MNTPTIASPGLSATALPLATSHPGDTAGLLLGLLHLSRDESATESDVIGRETMRRLLSALHFRDLSTVRHAQRVAILSVGIAESLGWDPAHLKVLEVAALLHDLGKIGVPDNILGKPGKLSPEEADLMALHHHIGVDVLQACRIDREVIDIVSQSQDHYNGAADGFRRIGSEVHQGSRILAVADAYDSMTTHQVFRDAMGHERAMQMLKESAGSRFDGNVIQALSRWLDRQGAKYRNKLAEVDASEQSGQLGSLEEVLEAARLGNIFSYLYVVESLYDGFYVVDSHKRVAVWNQSMADLAGYSVGEVTGREATSDLFARADQYGEAKLNDSQIPLLAAMQSGRARTDMIQIQKKQGDWLPVEVQTVPLVDRAGMLHGAAQIFRDLTNRNRKMQSHRDLTLAASRDALTQVANRGQLETHLMTLLSEYQTRTDPEPFSVIFIDVDHFKSVNDTYGHDVGDDVLIAVAKLLQHETYSGELVGRYGGEEFVVVCPDTDLDAAVRRAERLRTTLKSAKVSDTHEIQMTASFGVAAMEPGDSMASLVRRADRAVFISKETGRNKTTSLTGLQFDEEQKQNDKPAEKSHDPYLLEANIEAFLALDMINIKMGGFIQEVGGKLGKATDERIEIKLGRRSLFGSWGSTADSQPVVVVLEMHKPSRSDRPQPRGGAMRTKVKITIRPQGRPKKPEVFQDRAKAVFRTLKSFLQV